jgi:hypothetical protein
MDYYCSAFLVKDLLKSTIYFTGSSSLAYREDNLVEIESESQYNRRHVTDL